MSEKEAIEGPGREDRAILQALARIAASGTGESAPAAAGSADEEARVREYVELLGLLPYVLEPEPPSAGLRERILARAGGSAAVGRGFDEVTLASLAAADGDISADVTLQRPGDRGPREAVPREAVPREAVPREAVPREAVPREAVPREAVPSEVGPWAPEPPTAVSRAELPPNAVTKAPRTPWWAYAMAATLAACVLGLALLTGKVGQQAAIIARLTGEMQVLPVRDLGTLPAEFSSLQRRFHMVTAIARQAYPMKTVQPPGPGVQTDGIVYVCGNHQRWYLNIQGLEPPPPDREYHLWFLTDEGAINGGPVEVGPDATSERDAQTMPEGTRGFAVSLEEKAGSHREMKGMMVLLAEESVSL